MEDFNERFQATKAEIDEEIRQGKLTKEAGYAALTLYLDALITQGWEPTDEQLGLDNTDTTGEE